MDRRIFECYTRNNFGRMGRPWRGLPQVAGFAGDGLANLYGDSYQLQRMAILAQFAEWKNCSCDIFLLVRI